MNGDWNMEAEVDIKEAIKRYKMAAEQGNTDAMVSLANTYFWSDDYNIEIARPWYEKAAAEENAEADIAKRETVEIRNAGESAVFQAEKILSDDKDKIPDDIKSDVEAKIGALKDILADGDADTSTIASATEELQTTLQTVGQAVYEASQAAGTEENESDEDAAADSDGDDADDDTVEGEFREV